MENINNVPAISNSPVIAGFQSNDGFTLLQRVAKVFNSSNMVPTSYQGEKNIGNCIIAINIANKLNVDPLTVMQNLNVINGRPSWSSQFLISLFNLSGKFSPIHYQSTGEKGTDSQGVFAYTFDLANGERIDGEEITISSAKTFGWFKNPIWNKMPGQMLRYRAAAWLIRSIAPEISFGLYTQDEALDIPPETKTQTTIKNEKTINEIPDVDF